ncbi:sensor histidine kinase [Marinicella gelatinilytica]|uniref:sensor histidine kinase n=1 Tax=Marinicella gelatinilytica TaxID=2996017 RepID=UPI002260DC9A|nr:HAMP domain-containing sensor histidine kinase [Marinicella gelatinilytica]MCX7544443.1 HAMP domain-containing sensor histidine kinase [Marinicella gelatinilytica]
MNFRNSIKSRIIIAFLAFSSLLTLLFAVASLSIRQNLQTELIEQTIKQDLDGYMTKLAANPQDVLGQSLSSNVQGVITTPDNFHTDLPLSYADLEDGTHIITEGDKTYIVAVNKQNKLKGQPVWGYIKYDISHMKQNDRVLWGIFAGMLIVFLILAYVLAIYVSKKALKPLSKLAAKLENLSAHTHIEPLAPYFPEDEVGKIAHALDNYAQSLTDYVTRDKEFNADVSHELRTPLAVITSTVELIKSNPNISEKELSRINRIERAVKQSSELTETLLLLAREERKENQGLERTQPAIIIRKILESYEPTLKLKPVKTKVIEKDWLQVKAPESVISVVLGNLIGNAIKYTTEGTIHIIIDTHSIIVQDEGVGVNESELPKLFERHYRANKTSSKGSGIGLAIVKRLCELYNWDIEIRQNKTAGLTAILTFNPD